MERAPARWSSSSGVSWVGWYAHSAPSAAPQRGSSSSSARAWRLRAARHSLEAAGPLGALATASGARASRLQSHRPTARDHPGREPRVRPHPVVIGSELIYYEQARTRTYCLPPLPLANLLLPTYDLRHALYLPELRSPLLLPPLLLPPPTATSLSTTFPTTTFPTTTSPTATFPTTTSPTTTSPTSTSPTATSPTASRWRPCWLRRSSS